MKKTIQLITIAAAFAGIASLNATEIWEGSDDFSSSANSASLWKKIADHPTKGRAFVEGGEVRYSATGDASDAAWIWGKRGLQIPSSASWEMECTLRLPINPGLGVNFTKAGMFIASPSVGKGAYRALTFKVYQRYDSNSGIVTGFPQPIPETDYSRGGEFSRSNDLPLTDYYPTLGLVYRHDALNQTDDYEIYEVNGGGNRNLLASQSYLSGLAADSKVVVGLVLAGKKKWSGSSLALDNWSIKAFTPDPINLNVKTGNSKGVAYSVAVINLGMSGSKLTGTVALTVGTASASLPITGSVDKNGYFALTAKGTGANKGFGCVLLYDVATGTYRPNKNSVTAPKQKVVNF